ncbi:Glycosyl transferases group 1 [Georgenia satyanarayanai]|uniref:Glycosyl transferases group 1 n=1 Tax=Georgenia satyanarayanai TaxID=860221 RepID=A0A2Y9AD47_9MICO|nr:glycosyltransferase family 4 protein [Georgenia satyanarayanai]PYG00131.1 glycosyl transferase family 1 [Georgenia satyanarayanai]SSA40207.1 Glycosyl transferases group 1 [Georgenia satyanarayanai]
MTPLRFVVPARGAGPSGGDVYDSHLARAWDAEHGRVDVLALPGTWPRPGATERHALALALRTTGTVLLDGLVGSPCPEEVEHAVAAGARVVLLVHLPLPAEAGLPPREAERLAGLESRTVRAASVVVTTSHWAAGDLVRRYGRDDVVVAVPGAVRGPAATGSRPPHLLVLGALTAVKNHAVLVPALATLRDLPWQATFAGPTGAQPAVAGGVARALAKAGLAGRVDLPGSVTGADLEALWVRTDLLLVPSLVETYGLVVTEALARTVPAVVAAGTGAVEALTGSPTPLPTDDVGPGAAVPPTDPAAWERVLHRWLTTPQLRAGWRAAAQVRREQLRTWADTAADLRRGLLG